MKIRRSIWSAFFVVISLSIVVVIISCNIGFVSPHFISSSSTTTPAVPTTVIKPGEFVYRFNTQLMLNGYPFRFAGANMHWLALDDSANYPSQFQVNDGLDAAKEMGATVVRSHDLGISVGCSNCIEPSRGVFNDTAFAHVDYVIKAARDHGIRLIIPLTDNWHFAEGGKHTFTDWRHITDENQFYLNPQVIRDFEEYVSALLNHVNIYTGIAYKNDPTIMAWETGNELNPPTGWTQIISTFIKSIDQKHLVIDGRSGIDPNAASLKNIDIVSHHYYPKSVSELENDAKAAQKAAKAFMVGEFDWNDANGGDTLSRFLSAIEANSAIAGDAFWELWPHDDEYGYVSSEKQFTLHYPGDSAAMRISVQQLRMHAYKMRGLQVPIDIVPGSPEINVVIRSGTNDMLVWRGTTVAASYTIERSTSSATGPWTVICNKCATDTSTPWMDMTTPAGALWYKVTAYNLAGVAGKPSSPYEVAEGNIIIDNLKDWSKVFAHSSNLSFDTTDSQYMNSDSSTVVRTAATNEFIIWKQNDMKTFQAIAYFWPHEAISSFTIYTSINGRDWKLSQPSISNLYGNWLEYIYTLNGMSKVNYVKMVWNNTDGQIWSPQLGKVTLTY